MTLLTILNDLKGLDMLVLFIGHVIDLWRKAKSKPPATTEPITHFA